MEYQSPILSKVTGVILWLRNLERSVDMNNKLLRLFREQQEHFLFN